MTLLFRNCQSVYSVSLFSRLAVGLELKDEYQFSFNINQNSLKTFIMFELRIDL